MSNINGCDNKSDPVEIQCLTKHQIVASKILELLYLFQDEDALIKNIELILNENYEGYKS